MIIGNFKLKLGNMTILHLFLHNYDLVYLRWQTTSALQSSVWDANPGQVLPFKHWRFLCRWPVWQVLLQEPHDPQTPQVAAVGITKKSTIIHEPHKEKIKFTLKKIFLLTFGTRLCVAVFKYCIDLRYRATTDTWSWTPSCTTRSSTSTPWTPRIPRSSYNEDKELINNCGV